MAITAAAGGKCLENLRKLANEGAAQPPPEFMPELNAMRRSLEAVRDGTVVAAIVVDDNLLDAVLDVRALIIDWLLDGQCLPNVVPQIEEFLRRLSVDLNAVDSSS